MKKYKYIITALLLGLLSTWFISCDDEEGYKPFYDADEMQIAEYIASRDDLSELSELLEYTELKGLMSFYGTYTFFAPTNEAFHAFYTKMGKQSYTDFDKAEVKKIVENLIIGSKMFTTRTGEGSLPDTTMAGSNLVVTIEKDADGLAFLLNKESKIIERDIELPNGIVQIVDGVISVVDFSVSGWVKNHAAEFSIFNEALERTKVDSVLNERIAFVKNGAVFRNYFTLWAVPDVAYITAGINSFEELAAKYNKNGQPVNSPTSSLHQYMLYHCVDKLLSLSEFKREVTHVVTVNKRLFQIEIDKEDAVFKINREENGAYVGINSDASNNNTNNGYVHILTSPLTEIQFKPVKRIVSVCHHPDVPWQQMITDGLAGKHVNWPSGTGDELTIPYGALSGIRFHRETLAFIDNHMYSWKYNPAGLLFTVETNSNNLIWYEFDLPPIAKGKYDVAISYKRGQGRAIIQCFFNGERFGSIFDMEGSGGFVTASVGVMNVEASEKNVFRMKEIKSGMHLISEIVFTPVE